MKKILICGLAAVCLMGCVSARIPKYLVDKNPYKKVFFAGFDATVGAAEQSLAELGWKVEETGDPAVYERSVTTDEGPKKQILLFSEVRQTPYFLGTRYSKVNLFVRSVDSNTTEAEIRYLAINSFPIKNLEGYRNDGLANRIFTRMADKLE